VQRCGLLSSSKPCCKGHQWAAIPPIGFLIGDFLVALLLSFIYSVLLRYKSRTLSLKSLLVPNELKTFYGSQLCSRNNQLAFFSAGKKTVRPGKKPSSLPLTTLSKVFTPREIAPPCPALPLISETVVFISYRAKSFTFAAQKKFQ
jgi:hypothetical protein